jgi:hypothetical protein
LSAPSLQRGEFTSYGTSFDVGTRGSVDRKQPVCESFCGMPSDETVATSFLILPLP